MKRGRIQQKRGQGLPLNTVILLILVILVLVVVAAFFLGGTASITEKIRALFFGSTAGTDRVFAVGNCKEFCNRLQLLPKSAFMGSPYCKEFERIDSDNDGTADYISDVNNKKQYVRYYCWNKDPLDGDPLVESLDVSCQVEANEQSYSPDIFCTQSLERKPGAPLPGIIGPQP